MIYNLVKILQNWRGTRYLALRRVIVEYVGLAVVDYQNLFGALSGNLKFDLVLVVVRDNVVVLVVVGSR